MIRSDTLPAVRGTSWHGGNSDRRYPKSHRFVYCDAEAPPEFIPLVSGRASSGLKPLRAIWSPAIDANDLRLGHLFIGKAHAFPADAAVFGAAERHGVETEI